MKRWIFAPAAAAAVQGYQMRDEALDEDGEEDLDNPDHDGGIRTALRVRFEDPAAAKAKYGPIASWDTSGITDMSELFWNRPHFNEDISRWNVSNVVDMAGMFMGARSFNGDLSCWDVGQVREMGGMFGHATSFDRQLGGAWATSTATTASPTKRTFSTASQCCTDSPPENRLGMLRNGSM